VIALMHPIFMVARLPIFLIYTILTCCCDKGEDLGNEFPYEKLLISFDYCENHAEALDNQLFAAQPWAEYRSNQNLRNVRRDQ
jgi:hypothetical protein